MTIFDKMMNGGDFELPEGVTLDFGDVKVSGTAGKRKVQIQQKEALAILNRGTGFDDTGEYQFQDRDDALNFIMEKYDIDIADPEIQTALSKYKEREEEITPASKGLFGFGATKYPTKQRYGHTYEQHPDGKWYKVKE